MVNLGIIGDSESMPKVLKPRSLEYTDHAPYSGPTGITGSDHYSVTKEQPSSVHDTLWPTSASIHDHLRHAIRKTTSLHPLNSFILLLSNFDFQMIFKSTNCLPSS